MRGSLKRKLLVAGIQNIILVHPLLTIMSLYKSKEITRERQQKYSYICRILHIRVLMVYRAYLLLNLGAIEALFADD